MFTLAAQTLFVCIAIQFCVQEGNVAFFLRSKVEYFLPWYIRKPLYDCLPCMASVWGSAVYFVHGNPLNWNWLFFVLLCCGINCAFDALFYVHYGRESE